MPFSPTASRARKLAESYMVGALRELAAKRCQRSNCGQVCLCGPCSARYALPFYDDRHPDAARIRQEARE